MEQASGGGIVARAAMDARDGAALDDDDDERFVGGAIVVVAKCPLPGSCKTRLIPLLGEEGAASLARAMLSDVLSSLSECVSGVCGYLSCV